MELVLAWTYLILIHVAWLENIYVNSEHKMSSTNKVMGFLIYVYNMYITKIKTVQNLISTSI